ncbi:hypothetical protein O181_008544 [Austropuccinia psidii MF-1]|uniref:Uncharacterized protein n=1 Tax=Austropuccinia psidii MF-1 TaxID=1389203 RepID=A0A9Q3BP25_9BASI|nr:hypothetical protein [Austropuccinia psidii MF-1]
MDKITEENFNMLKLSTPFSDIIIPDKPKEEIKNPLMTNLSHKDNEKVSMKETPQLKKWSTLTGEGQYDHMSFIKAIDMLKKDYDITDEFNQCQIGKNTWSWWKNEIITNWENDACKYKIENSFQNSFFDSDEDKPLTCFTKQVERLHALYPEVSHKMVGENWKMP